MTLYMDKKLTKQIQKWQNTPSSRVFKWTVLRTTLREKGKSRNELFPLNS